MIKDVSKIHLDKKATDAWALTCAGQLGMSEKEYKRAVRDLSARYREAAHKKRLSEIDKYVVIAQVLHIRLLSDLLVITEK